MRRVFFRKSSQGNIPSSGSIISSIQENLNAQSVVDIQVDGIFGAMTRAAVKAYQASAGLDPSGEVDKDTWRSLMRTDEPSIFQRCLQVTAHFEGTGFERAAGNFDGAGLTWGIIGFTLANGELGALLQKVNRDHPSLLARAFGSDAATILAVTQLPRAERIAWGDSVSRGANKVAVAEPWRTYFHDLGTYREVQSLQVARAREVYWTIARRDAVSLGMEEEADLTLLYDVAVQNGGMESKGRRAKALARFSGLDAAGRRRVVADVVADSASKRWREDVRRRKMAICDGSGTVHGGRYDFADWGILPGKKPVDPEG